MRLDFDSFTIAGPSTDTTVVTNSESDTPTNKGGMQKVNANHESTHLALQEVSKSPNLAKVAECLATTFFFFLFCVKCTVPDHLVLQASGHHQDIFF